MGSTLTNTQPKDTYKSLLKTSDSTELSASLKTVSDGNGNDSALAVSSKAVAILKTDTLPTEPGSINHYTNNYVYMRGGTAGLVLGDDGFSNRIQFEDNGDIIQEANGTTYTRLTTTGYFRLSSSALGIQFNGDTAAANALDDYEEGTWTMGVSFGGASVGVTYAANTGGYTKIGRQVTATGYLQLSSKGSSTGVARITGLPFTINNSDAATSSASIRFNIVTFANQFQAWGQANSTLVNLEEITEAGTVTSLTEADFANNSQVIFSLTYFV